MSSSQAIRSEPKLSLKQRQEKARDEHFASIVSESLQLKRTLWLVLRTVAKGMVKLSPSLAPDIEPMVIVIDQADMSLLWDLQYSEVPGEQTKLRLTAGLLPEATSEQIACLKAVLLGAEPSLRAAREDSAVGLSGRPLGYLQLKLMEGPDGIVWSDADQKWVAKPLPSGTTPS